MSRLASCALAVVLALPLALSAQEDPAAVVESTAGAVLGAMEGRRDELRESPEELRQLVEEHFLPRFDRAYAAFLVLGRHSRGATQEQRRAFTDALYGYVLRQYGEGLLEFTSDRLKVLPYRGKPEDTKARVRTELTLDNGTNVPVVYSLRKTDGVWRVYDVNIEGISYVKNFRTQLGEEIKAKGLDAVIASLQTESEGA